MGMHNPHKQGAFPGEGASLVVQMPYNSFFTSLCHFQVS
jgi:hypothetical protein